MSVITGQDLLQKLQGLDQPNLAIDYDAGLNQHMLIIGSAGASRGVGVRVIEDDNNSADRCSLVGFFNACQEVAQNPQASNDAVRALEARLNTVATLLTTYRSARKEVTGWGAARALDKLAAFVLPGHERRESMNDVVAPALSSAVEAIQNRTQPVAARASTPQHMVNGKPAWMIS